MSDWNVASINNRKVGRWNVATLNNRKGIMSEQDQLTDEQVDEILEKTTKVDPDDLEAIKHRHKIETERQKARIETQARELETFRLSEAKRKEAKLVEAGDLKGIIAQKDARIAELENKLDNYQALDLRIQIGTAEGLPIEVARLLPGTNEDVIRNNAQKILKSLPKSSGRVDGNRRTGQPRKRLNEAQLREQSRSKTTVTKM